LGKRRSCLGSIFTNIFLAVLIIALYHATEQSAEWDVLPVSAPVYRGSGEKAALQFTVSWNAEALSDIIEMLSTQQVKATFAVSGEWAAENPETLRCMAQDGHEIAVMGYYPQMDGSLSWVKEDLRRAINSVEETTGKAPEIYFSGERGKVVSSMAAKQLGLTHVSCTVDMLCAKGSAKDIIARIPEENIPGGILLLQPTAACAEALEGIIQALNEKGIQPTSTGNVLERNTD